MKKPSFFPVIIGTGFGSGFSPFAPGTAGALLAVLIWFGISFIVSEICLIWLTVALILFFTVMGVWANELKWRDFDLNLLFTYSLGRDMYKTYDIRSLDAYDGGQGGQALYINTDKASFWTEDNHKAQYARLGTLNSM